MEMASRAALPGRGVPAQAVELVNHNRPPPPCFFVSVDSKELRFCVSLLDATLAG
jgi:hypothetical protein